MQSLWGEQAVLSRHLMSVFTSSHPFAGLIRPAAVALAMVLGASAVVQAQDAVERRKLDALIASPEALSEAIIQSDGPFEMDGAGFGAKQDGIEPDTGGIGQGQETATGQSSPDSVIAIDPPAGSTVIRELPDRQLTDAASPARQDRPLTDITPDTTTATETPPDTIELIDESKPLRIGLIAERGTQYLQTRIAPFRRYLEETLGRSVEVFGFSSPEQLIAAHAARKIDYAPYPASLFAMASASCGCLTPLVAPVSTDAPDGTYMVLVVRSDSGIQSLADMAGRSLALSSKSGALPFYMALNELRKDGFNPEQEFSSLFNRGDPVAALDMLAKGDVDAALVWSTTRFNQYLATSPGAVASYKAAHGGQGSFLSIWQSKPVPAGPHAVHNDMSKQDKADLRAALLAMNQRDPAAYDAIELYHAGGFRAVALEDYAPLLEVATAK